MSCATLCSLLAPCSATHLVLSAAAAGTSCFWDPGCCARQLLRAPAACVWCAAAYWCCALELLPPPAVWAAQVRYSLSPLCTAGCPCAASHDVKHANRLVFMLSESQSCECNPILWYRLQSLTLQGGQVHQPAFSMLVHRVAYLKSNADDNPPLFHAGAASVVTAREARTGCTMNSQKLTPSTSLSSCLGNTRTERREDPRRTPDSRRSKLQPWHMVSSRTPRSQLRLCQRSCPLVPPRREEAGSVSPRSSQTRQYNMRAGSCHASWWVVCRAYNCSSMMLKLCAGHHWCPH